MAEDSNAPAPQQRQFDPARQGRGGPREQGGFRIRLSDNEMRAVRAVQDAFQLRSPVAALGFSVRSMAQMLEQGQLDELVAQQRQQAGSRPMRGEGGRGEGNRGEGNRGEGGRGDGPRRGGRPFPEGRSERGPRIDPLARPPRPTAMPVTEVAVSELNPTEANPAGVSPGEGAGPDATPEAAEAAGSETASPEPVSAELPAAEPAPPASEAAG